MTHSQLCDAADSGWCFYVHVRVCVCVAGEGSAVCDELNDKIVHHIYSCFMEGICLMRFFTRGGRQYWYYFMRVTHLVFHLKPSQGAASPL